MPQPIPCLPDYVSVKCSQNPTRLLPKPHKNQFMLLGTGVEIDNEIKPFLGFIKTKNQRSLEKFANEITNDTSISTCFFNIESCNAFFNFLINFFTKLCAKFFTREESKVSLNLQIKSDVKVTKEIDVAHTGSIRVLTLLRVIADACNKKSKDTNIQFNLHIIDASTGAIAGWENIVTSLLNASSEKIVNVKDLAQIINQSMENVELTPGTNRDQFNRLLELLNCSCSDNFTVSSMVDVLKNAKVHDVNYKGLSVDKFNGIINPSSNPLVFSPVNVVDLNTNQNVKKNVQEISGLSSLYVFSNNKNRPYPVEMTLQYKPSP